MRLSLLLAFLIVILPVSCKKEEKRPKGILTKEEMVDWMIHIYLAEARTTLLNVNRDSAYRIFKPYQDSLMRVKGIQDSTFAKSYQYYLDNSNELEAVYDAVIDSLSLREAKVRQSLGN